MLGHCAEEKLTDNRTSKAFNKAGTVIKAIVVGADSEDISFPEELEEESVRSMQKQVTGEPVLYSHSSYLQTVMSGSVYL